MVFLFIISFLIIVAIIGICVCVNSPEQPKIYEEESDYEETDPSVIKTVSNHLPDNYINFEEIKFYVDFKEIK